MKKSKNIFILIGAKGSGKTFIGEVFEKYFRIHFVRVEKWAAGIKKDREPDDESYIKEFFETVERKIRDLMGRYNEIVFESTGLSPYFDFMYYHLQNDYHVILIRIETDPQLCLKRIRKRDRGMHINVSNDLVNKINQEVARKNIHCEYKIENSSTSLKGLRSKISEIIRRAGKF